METYSRAVEPEPSVTITDATFFGHGWQPLTIGVLQAIWFMPQGMGFDVDGLTAWFRQLGWKSGNGQPIGVDIVRRELGLIRKAGYIQANRLRGDGGKVTGIRYEVSKRAHTELAPAGPWIPIQSSDSEKPSSDHVPPMTGDGDWGYMADQENRRSDHVPPMTAPGRWGHMVKRPFAQLAPCAPNGVHPPHPPEEVETSSPSPHKPEEEAGERFTSEDIYRAEHFLQLLPAPWTAGRQTAKAQASKLLAAAAEQGWQLDDQLAAQLTANPDGIKNYPAVLKARIADLPLYAAVHRAPTVLPAAVAQPAVLPTWCEDLDCDRETRRRYVVRPDGFGFTGPCPDCHPDSQTQEAA